MSRSFLSFILALASATALLLGAGASPASAQGPKDSTAKPNKEYPEVKEALQRLAVRDIKGAEKLLIIASQRYPELPSAYVMLYQIFAQMNQPNAARLQLETAVRKTPSDPEPCVILGNIALQERRVFEATSDLEKANQLLASYKSDTRKGAIEQQIKSGLAQVAEINEEWKEAEARLRDLLKLRPRTWSPISAWPARCSGRARLRQPTIS